MSKFPRLPPRLDRIFARRPLYFVTFCTFQRQPLLASAAVHHAFVAFSERAYEQHHVAVGRYVIMPDHVHLFVCGDIEFELGRWMGMLKQAIAKAISPKARCSRPPVDGASGEIRREGAEPAPPTGRRLQAHTIWQRGFFDHVLRSNESYGQKWNYVRDNPVRAGLVTEADDWPCAGEIIYIDRV